MQRYLLNISYIGTHFKGMQRQVSARNGRADDPSTVQGQLEIALKGLRPKNIPATTISSRTDTGVHCLHSTVHVDLLHPSSTYKPLIVTTNLNKYFLKRNIPIRILKTYLVPNTFHCRHQATSRTYLYRFAIVKSETPKGMLVEHLPVEDLERCLYLCAPTFDLNKAQEAAKLFEGVHDFRTFMGKAPLYPDLVTRRNIEKLDIYETKPIQYSSYSWPYCIESSKCSDYKHYEVIFKSSGFLYKQVRRTVASLIAVAKGIVTPNDIKFMLEIPSHRSWNPRIKTVAAHGLYLCEVTYSREDRQTFKEDLDF